jgi:hypothetical protein
MPNAIETLPALLNDETLEFSKTKVTEAETALPFLLNISEDDVPGMIKLDDKKENFIRDILTEMKNAKGKIPTVANADDIKDYFNNYDKLYELESIALEFYQKIKRNRIDNGNKSYRGALQFYRSLDPAVQAKVPGAAEMKKRLSAYFPSTAGQPKSDKNAGKPDE